MGGADARELPEVTRTGAQEAIAVAGNMTMSEDERVTALQVLQELVEPIDNANGPLHASSAVAPCAAV